MRPIERAMTDLAKAKERVLRELRKAFPVGARVQVRLSDRQVIPSEADVVTHTGDGYVRVRLVNTPTRDTRSVFYVHVAGPGGA